MSKDMIGSVMVVGGGIGGIQSALDLANAGFLVHLIEKSPAIGGVMSALDKTFPTNDCAMCILSPKLVEAGRHENINLLTLSEVASIEGEAGNFNVTLMKGPRYVDAVKCTSCGDCVAVCPVSLPSAFDFGFTDQKAVYKKYAQAIPGAFVIQKADRAPCRLACPAGLNVQGYVQMVGQGKYKEALKLIMENLPLPGVLGRICPHGCEDACRRCEVDEPVAIRDLKRLAADMCDPREVEIECLPKRDEKVAIIGSGPAGLSAAYHLARKGVLSTIYEAMPQPGGMLRAGIPAHRLPREVLDKDIEVVTNLGVEIKLNTPLGSDLTIDDLLGQGYKAVYLAIGAHKGIELGIPGEKANGVRQGVSYLREVNLEGKAETGKKVAVIGGGNVAIDVARCAVRMGAEEVNIIYRRSRNEMPAWEEEILAAEAEGVKLTYLAAPQEILTEDGAVTGLRCIRMELTDADSSGRRRPVPVPGSEFEIEIDQLFQAIGQRPDLSFIEDVTGLDFTRWGTIETDAITYATGREGVFAGGDLQTGPWVAIGAIAAGQEAAESIVRYFDGADMAEGREPVITDDPHYRPVPEDMPAAARAKMAELAVEKRKGNFNEVELGYGEEDGRAEAGRCLNCGFCCECYQCVEACGPQAVTLETHTQVPEKVELQVGSIILSPGFECYDPSGLERYGYGVLSNVVTSMEFERILSASGPFGGHLVRPSDRKEPKKIAWLQCIGSRDIREDSHGYCSGVCCMYAIKEALVAKEHAGGDLETTIFFMDMRTHGKGFEQTYNRAKNEAGVRFLRSRVHTIEPAGDTDELKIMYADESGELHSEIFHMAVLSVGVEISPELKQFAKRIGIDANPDGFAAVSGFTPVETSRAGVYACGAFTGPKDIPQTVMDASAASSASAALLSEARNTLTREKIWPDETPVSAETPRIGVFVCHCGTNIGGVVDVPAVKAYAETLPNVAFAADNIFTCSQDTQEAMRKVIAEHRLNRVIVAACTPRTHEPLFQETIREAGLNPYLFEFANIRDQNSWVHQNNPEAATQKAKDLIRMAAAKASLLEPIEPLQIAVNPNALVIGGGVAGMSAALNLADQGFKTWLIERALSLGGHAINIRNTWNGEDVGAFLEDLRNRVTHHENIEALLGSEVSQIDGFVGNFTTTVQAGDIRRNIQHGAVILAVGGQAFEPDEYLYGQSDRVLKWHEMDQLFESDPEILETVKGVAFIQCVGSREPERPYCSKICCTASIQNALRLKEKRPDLRVYVLYRDIRTFGRREALYSKARHLGVIFIRFNVGEKPVVEKDGNGGLLITVKDHVLGRPIQIPVDYLNLATAIVPTPEQNQIAQMLKVPLNGEGFYLEAHIKLRPVDFSTDGVFVCGLAHYPKPIEESIAQAQAAAGRAASLLVNKTIDIEPIVSAVDESRCIGCGLCESSCSFGAIRLKKVEGKGWRAENYSALCKGCGVCAAACPQQAIDMKHFREKQIRAAIQAGGAV